MRKIILVLNHVQAGFGSDENAMLPPGGKKSAIGPGKTLEPFLAELDAKIIATLYCGDQYFASNPLEVQKKFVGFAKKFEADAVLCGPAMHYPLFGEMCGSLAKAFNEQGIPAIAAMSLENPATEKYSKDFPVVKMPKKGGIGLNDSLQNMAKLVVEKANDHDTKELEEKICF
ncbi:glycine/betaine/sarcosine/D-proline family reductase selenoprotein B [Bacillus sp. APMAM]|uniref:GrdB-related putative oxidoreductase n=1 Tax=Margalitia sp. FSL K6-0131 TaxID=2954604 RepID=UPI000F8600A2|nr:glycine/betaine/sarcosine/D-proline family reductase selenoprotein B [Bacillus sp. APMAM]RTZ57331.1 glycine/betaine/sarcosine/D-proline family reductase selenoprotein B [Bacillus sp. SAJ1]